MFHLKPVSFYDIQHWFVDYQKKSKNFEIPPEEGEMIGIFRDQDLIGYFITLAYQDRHLEINQGYLRQDARHKRISQIAMSLLEKLAKSKGYTRIDLGTNRAVGSYQAFMRNLGYRLVRAEFSKEL